MENRSPANQRPTFRWRRKPVCESGQDAITGTWNCCHHPLWMNTRGMSYVHPRRPSPGGSVRSVFEREEPSMPRRRPYTKNSVGMLASVGQPSPERRETAVPHVYQRPDEVTRLLNCDVTEIAMESPGSTGALVRSREEASFRTVLSIL